MTARLRLEGVRFGFGGPPIVDGLGLDVPPGDFLGVIGPNGAGKSTVLRLMLGLLAPQAGRVTLDDTPIARVPRRAFARRVGAVLQEESVEFPFTALEVVLMGRIARLGPLGFERADDLAAAEQAMRATGVFAFAGRPLHTLSGGERKRVLLARALAQEPEVLILDEPAAALDVHHQLAIFDLLAERNRAGTTVVVVAHDLNLAAAYCRRLLLLAPGHAPAVGPPAELLTEARIREAFGVEIYRGENPLSGAPIFIPTSRKNVSRRA